MRVLRETDKSSVDGSAFYKFEEMENAGIELDSNPTNLFKKLGINTDGFPQNWSYENLRQLPQIWESIKTNIAQNEMFNDEAKGSIIASKADVAVQKVTYAIDDNEDIEAITKSLKNQETNALFRAVEMNKEEREIIVYSSRFGVWKNANNEFEAKQVPTNGSTGEIRPTYTVRGQKDITKLTASKGLNYAILEDTKSLFEKDLINNINSSITKAHYKLELDEEDLKAVEIKEQAVKEAVKEVSHTNKENTPTNATSNDMYITIEENSKQLKTIDLREVSVERVDSVEKYQEGRDKVYVDFAEKMINDLKEKQALELAVMQEKINSISGNKVKLKQDAILLLQNGMSLIDMNTELSAKKYNDMQIKVINEEFKKEIIDSVEKENELKKVSKSLVKFEEKFNDADAKRVVLSEQLTIANNKVREVTHEADTSKRALFSASKMIEKVEEQIGIYAIANNDLKAEKQQKEEEIIDLEAELDEKSEVIYKQKDDIQEKIKIIEIKEEIISSKDKTINQKDETINQKDEIIGKVSNKNEELNSKNIHLERDNAGLQSEVKFANEKVKSLIEQIEANRTENQQIISSLKQTNKTMYEENTLLKQQLGDYQAIKNELEKYKKNVEINTSYKEKTSEVEKELKKEEKIIEEVKTRPEFKSKLSDTTFNFPNSGFNKESNPNNNNNQH